MIRALIVDDERHTREELASLVQQTGSFEVIGTCANAVEAIKAINRDRPEVLFLDIQMPVLNGFELLSMIDEEVMPHVVFITAYDEYAVKAFEEKAIDYLLKPVEAGRLAKTVAKVRSAIGAGTQQQLETATLDRIPCVSVNKIRLVDPDDIVYVYSDISGVHLVTGQGTFFTELTLKVIEDRTSLLRCHKQYLVNIEQVEEITLLEAGLAEIRTRTGTELPVSRRFLKIIKDRLGL